jgi:hypothetical protein
MQANKRVPETDEEALVWLADKPAVAIDLYKLYRTPGAFNMDVKTALYETIKACVPCQSNAQPDGQAEQSWEN